jgi:hypothetical protein
MIRETYKGRQLKVVKGKTYGKSRITVNGTECGEWFGTQADVIEWAKRTIDDADSRPFEGRWNECWYEPGTYELNEIGHVTAPGGTCSCDRCKTEPWNSCQNITAGGVCVCHYCMKPYLAEKPAPVKAPAEEAPSEATDSDVIGIKNARNLVAAAKSAGLTVMVETTRTAGDHYEVADYTAPDSLSVRIRIAIPGDDRHAMIALWNKRLDRSGRGKLIAARTTTRYTSTDLKSSDLWTALRDLVIAHRRNA